MKQRSALLLVAALFVIALATISYADDRDKCQNTIKKAEARLDKEIRRHGGQSKEANDQRRKLNAAREGCVHYFSEPPSKSQHNWEESSGDDGRHNFDPPPPPPKPKPSGETGKPDKTDEGKIPQ